VNERKVAKSGRKSSIENIRIEDPTTTERKKVGLFPPTKQRGGINKEHFITKRLQIVATPQGLKKKPRGAGGKRLD